MSFDLFKFKDDEPKRKKLTQDERRQVLERQKEKCAICKTKFSVTSVIHLDHKKPLGLGGSDTLRNIQALCPNCHAKKTQTDRDKIAKQNRKEKEKGPYGDLLGIPKSRGKQIKNPFDIDLGLTPEKRGKIKDPFDIDLGISPKKKKKKDPFSIY